MREGAERRGRGGGGEGEEGELDPDPRRNLDAADGQTPAARLQKVLSPDASFSPAVRTSTSACLRAGFWTLAPAGGGRYG